MGCRQSTGSRRASVKSDPPLEPREEEEEGQEEEEERNEEDQGQEEEEDEEGEEGEEGEQEEDEEEEDEEEEEEEPVVVKAVAPAKAPPNVNPGPYAFLEQNPDGLYLTYDIKNHGTFQLVWSKTKVDQALAFARQGPFDPQIHQYKYKKVSELAKNTGNGGRQNYFQAWGLWVKEVKSHAGTFVILDGLDWFEQEDPNHFPKMRIIGQEGEKLIEVKRGLKNEPLPVSLAAF